MQHGQVLMRASSWPPYSQPPSCCVLPWWWWGATHTPWEGELSGSLPLIVINTHNVEFDQMFLRIEFNSVMCVHMAENLTPRTVSSYETETLWALNSSHSTPAAALGTTTLLSVPVSLILWELHMSRI